MDFYKGGTPGWIFRKGVLLDGFLERGYSWMDL